MPTRKSKKHGEIVPRFAARLRELRQSRGLTQAELAERAQVAATHLSELENAAIAPGIDLVDRLARALGTTAADLLPAAGGPDPLPLLKEHASQMLAVLQEKGDRESFLSLNPILALLVE